MVSMTDQLIGTPTFGDLVRRRSHTTSCVNVREWMIDGRCCRGNRNSRQNCLDAGRVLMDEPPRAPDLAPQRERFPQLDADLSPRLGAPARVQHHAQHAVDAEPGVPEAARPTPPQSGALSLLNHLYKVFRTDRAHAAVQAKPGVPFHGHKEAIVGHAQDPAANAVWVNTSRDRLADFEVFHWPLVERGQQVAHGSQIHPGPDTRGRQPMRPRWRHRKDYHWGRGDEHSVGIACPSTVFQGLTLPCALWNYRSDAPTDNQGAAAPGALDEHARCVARPYTPCHCTAPPCRENRTHDDRLLRIPCPQNLSTLPGSVSPSRPRVSAIQSARLEADARRRAVEIVCGDLTRGVFSDCMVCRARKL
jgi:hypothetical protein